MKTYTGKLYLVNITDSVLHMTHGESYTLKEVYIPSLKIFFNSQAYARYHKGRYDKQRYLHDVKVDAKFANNILKFLNAKDALDKFSKQYNKLLVVKTDWKCFKCGHVIKNLDIIRPQNNKLNKSSNSCIKCDGFYVSHMSDKQ